VREGAGQPSYSALEGTTDDGSSLADFLTERYGSGAGLVVHVMGLATDYAVLATALGLRTLLPDAEVVLLAGLCAGVHSDTTDAVVQMAQAGVRIVTGPVAAVPLGERTPTPQSAGPAGSSLDPTPQSTGA
jgi:nicotinamidase/pyrazinamidase